MDKLISTKELFNILNNENIPYNGDINYFILHAPEAIVRCKDCKWCKPINNEVRGFYKNCIRHEIAVYDDGFCAWGERKENGK